MQLIMFLLDVAFTLNWAILKYGILYCQNTNMRLMKFITKLLVTEIMKLVLKKLFLNDGNMENPPIEQLNYGNCRNMNIY